MLLALLSDTHDNVPATLAALRLLAPHKPDLYLHAGDLVSPEMLIEIEAEAIITQAPSKPRAAKPKRRKK